MTSPSQYRPSHLTGNDHHSDNPYLTGHRLPDGDWVVWLTVPYYCAFVVRLCGRPIGPDDPDNAPSPAAKAHAISNLFAYGATLNRADGLEFGPVAFAHATTVNSPRSTNRSTGYKFWANTELASHMPNWKF